MPYLNRIIAFGSRFIDYKMGIAGSVVMGSIVFAINYISTAEILGSMTAAIKQGSYTFLLGGSLMKGCEYIATHIKKPRLAIFLSSLIPSVLTLVLTFTMHNMKGTPKPLESTIPTTVIIPATIIWAYKKRKQILNIDMQQKN